MKLYFAYGANLNLQGMKSRCPNAVPVESFYLWDWRMIFSGVATIQPSPGNSVAGALWHITEQCEASLDSFEGYPYLYRKEIIKSQGREFMAYVMNSDYPYPPAQSYFDTIALGYQDWKLDLAYLDTAVKITTHETKDDMYYDAVYDKQYS